MSQEPEHKSTTTALIFTLALGTVGLHGIGLVYLGRLKIGMVLFFGGFAMFVFGNMLILPHILSLTWSSDAEIAVGIILLLAYIVTWVWSINQTHLQAKFYSQYVDEHGKAPW